MSTLMKETQALTPKKAVQAHVSVYSQSTQCTGNPSNAYVVNSGECYGVSTHDYSSAAIKVECASDSPNSPWTAELSRGLFCSDREAKKFSGGGGNDNSCTSCIYDSVNQHSIAINCGSSACVPTPDVYASFFETPKDDTCSAGSFGEFIKANKCTQVSYPIRGYVNVTCDEFTDASSWQMSTFADSDCSSPPAEVIHGTDANSCQAVTQVDKPFFDEPSNYTAHVAVNCAGQLPSTLPTPVPTGAAPEGFLTMFQTPDTCTTGPQVGLFVPLDTCFNLKLTRNSYSVRFTCSSADADATWTMETFLSGRCDSLSYIRRVERIGACDCTPLTAYTDDDDNRYSYTFGLSFNCGGNVPVSCAQAPTKVPTVMPSTAMPTTAFAQVELFSSDKTDSASVSVQLNECVRLSEQGPYVKMNCLAANSDSWWSMTIYDNKYCSFSPDYPMMTNVNDIGACINPAFPWELEYNNFTVASLSVDCGNALSPVTCASPSVATTTMSPSTVGGIVGGALAIVLVAVLLGLWMFGAVGLGAASMTVTSAPAPDASAQQVGKIDEASGVVSETAEETSNPINNSV